MDNEKEIILDDSLSSPNYQMLLSLFAKPCFIANITRNEEKWFSLLNIPSRKAINFLISKQLIETATVEERIVKKYKLSELKTIVKTKGLKLAGKKEELAKRILEVSFDEMNSATAGMELYKCTCEGKEIAERYIQKRDNARLDASRLILSLLEKGEYSEAVSIGRSYYEPEMALIDTFTVQDISSDLYKVNVIMNETPGILANVEYTVIHRIRLAVVLSCFPPLAYFDTIPNDLVAGTNFDWDTAIRMLRFYIDNKMELLQYQAEGIRKVELLACNDSCIHCKKKNNKKYKISDVPELPNPNCTSPYGCRCIYLSVFDS
jgi:hypothetical protein